MFSIYKQIKYMALFQLQNRRKKTHETARHHNFKLQFIHRIVMRLKFSLASLGIRVVELSGFSDIIFAGCPLTIAKGGITISWGTTLPGNTVTKSRKMDRFPKILLSPTMHPIPITALSMTQFLPTVVQLPMCKGIVLNTDEDILLLTNRIHVPNMKLGDTHCYSEYKIRAERCRHQSWSIGLSAPFPNHLSRQHPFRWCTTRTYHKIKFIRKRFIRTIISLHFLRGTQC